MPNLCLDGSHEQRIREAEERTRRAEETLVLYAAWQNAEKAYHDYLGSHSYTAGSTTANHHFEETVKSKENFHKSVIQYVEDFNPDRLHIAE